MKKLIACLLIAATSFISATAQDGERIFKKFKGDISLGFAVPIGSNAITGGLFAIEPKFALTDKLSVGLRIEAAVLTRATNIYANGNSDPNSDNLFGCYVATADYYFTNKYSFRPFAGAGAGVFSLADHLEEFDSRPIGTKFGGIIRAGAEVKHFRLGFEFNIIPGSTVSQYDNNTGRTAIRDIRNSYLGIKLGVCFGGGPR